MFDDLVKRLREDAPTALANCDFDFVEGWIKEAADAIEGLISDCEMYRDAMTIEHNRAATLQWEKEHRWIPVTEALPEVQDEYLVLWAHRADRTARLFYEILEFDGENWVDGIPQADPFGGFRVLYWMPLPEPPEEGKT